MAVRKRGSKWFVDVTLPDGERVRTMVGTNKQAHAVERQLTADIVSGKLPARPVDDIAIADFLPLYLEYARANKAKNTVDMEGHVIRGRIAPFFGRRVMSKVDYRMVERYKVVRQTAGVGARTINRELTLLSVIFRHAMRLGYARVNPVREVEKLKVSKRAPRYLSAEEVGRLLAAARTTYLYPPILAALHTGMRKSELFNLQWDDVDFSSNTITIQGKEDWHTKNYDYRTVSMTRALRETLSIVYQGRDRVQPYLFTYRGEQLTSTVGKMLNAIAARADALPCTLNTLRHTFASHLAMRGVPLMHIRELMGHRDFNTTLIYSHLSTESHRDDVHRLPFADPTELGEPDVEVAYRV